MARLIILLLSVFFLISSCQDQAVSPRVVEVIDSTAEEFAPDGRVARFDVEAVARPEGLTLTGESNLPAARDALLARLQEEGYSPIDSIRLLPDKAGLEGRVRGIVRLSVCNIRSRPGHSAELSTQATLGTPLRVHKRDGDWYLVQTPDDYFGWLDAGGFVPMDEPSFSRWVNAERVVFLPDFGFSYVAPGEEAHPVSDLVAGNILQRLGTSGDWVHVGYPDGREAYVHSGEVLGYAAWLASRDPQASSILATARSFLGRPYLWGGTSGKGVDCSGFTKTVFYQHGLLLPRDASQQVRVGVPVETDSTWQNLRPGDLLFFGRKAEEGSPERIVHVALYEGDGRIIHSAGTVKENSLRPGDPDFNAYRFQTFVRARRVLDDPASHGVIPLDELEDYLPGDAGH